MSGGRCHRYLFWALLLVFMASSVWWLLYMPYRPEAVFSAIPSNASFVSVHRNLAREIGALTRNPATRDLLASAGIRQADLADISSNRETRAWIQRLASKETVVAYVPALGYQRKPAWIFASWIGGESQRLRWQLRWFKPADFTPMRLEYGRTIWLTRTKFSQPGQRLSLALSEGMVLGCVSADPAGVRWLVETGDGHPTRPSVLSSGALTAARSLAPTNHQQWGWYSPVQGGDASRFAPNLIGFGATFLPDGRLDLALVANEAMPDAGALSGHPDFVKLAHLLGASPDLVTVLPLAWARPLFLQTTSPLWAEAVSELTDVRGAPTNALAFLALLNREHSGRVRSALGKTVAALVGKGLRVPTLVIGIQLDNQGEAVARVNRMSAVLNARYGWGLESRVVEMGGQSLTLVAETQRNTYGKFAPEEQVAYALVDKWLILSSNAAILRRLLEQNAAQPGVPTWSEPAAPDASSYAWADLNHSGKTLKDAMAVVQLALMVDDSPSAADTRAALETARKWIERAQGLELATVSIGSTGAVTRLDLVIGR